MKLIEQSILDVKEGIIVQQVNCCGVMGSGLAKSIKDKWPEVWESYKEKANFYKLGDLDVIDIEGPNGLYVANIYGQERYGTDGKQYTSYPALACGMSLLALNWHHKKIYLPYGLGCGLGGGDWDVVSQLIEIIIPRAIVCIKPGTFKVGWVKRSDGWYWMDSMNRNRCTVHQDIFIKEAYWSTWDENGCGGENSMSATVDMAKAEAEAALKRQGWY